MVSQKDKGSLSYLQGKFYGSTGLHQIHGFFLPNLQFLWKLHLFVKILLNYVIIFDTDFALLLPLCLFEYIIYERFQIFFTIKYSLYEEL